MRFNSDFKFDLLIGEIKEKELAEILSNKKIEVKNDLQANKTGNIFIEYKSRGKLSGISTTESDFYCIAIQNSFHLIRTDILKQKCRKYIGSNRDILGGDCNTSRGILLPVTDLID